MSNQTAVEWLITELKLNDTIDKENLIIARQIVEEAKAMEKEQIALAFSSGIAAHPYDFSSGEKYYHKTYGGDQ